MVNFMNNTTQLQNLLEKVNALPKAGSGGGVETCSIRIICNTSDIYGYSYLAYRNEQFVPVYFANGADSTTLDVVLDDVVCNGYIYVQTGITSSYILFSVNGEATADSPNPNMISSAYSVAMIYAPSSAGSFSTVTIIDDN